MINLSTAGIHMYYAVEATAGTMPKAKADYTDLKGIKSIPSMNPAPETIETTSLNETEFKTYVDGLKDLGGALEFTFNLNDEVVALWETLMEAYEAGVVAGKATWFYIEIPKMAKGIYFTGNPSALGMNEAGVSAVLETTTYITPTGAPVWDTKATA